MHFANASPEAITAEGEGDPADADGLLADGDGGLLAESPQAAIATEDTTATRTVRVTTDHGSLRDGSAGAATRPP